MDHVVTLIAPSASLLDPSRIATIRAAIAEAGGESGAIDWLGPGRACDLFFTALAPAPAQRAVAGVLAGAPIDCYAQSREGRKKRLLVCDMDSTILTGETLDDLSLSLPRAKAEIDALTRKSVSGALGFTESLIARVALMRGLTEADFAAAYARQELQPGAERLLAACRRLGIRTALVSGGFRYFTSRVARRLGFDVEIANELEMADGRTTGRLVMPIVDPEGEFGKLGSLKRLAREGGLDLTATAAIGDGANDIPMLKAAGLGIAWRGKPKVLDAVPCQLNHAGLDGLLYLMGYREAEIRR